MNKVLTTALLVTVASSTVALAQPRIVDEQPIYETRYHRTCTEVLVNKETFNPLGALIIGGATGAIAHKHIGGGSGADVAGVLGGLLGYQYGKNATTRTYTETETRCQNDPYQVRVGKIVTFDYEGYRFKERILDQKDKENEND